jgi:DNA repair exonuclease SbcCD ATPase subunit
MSDAPIYIHGLKAQDFMKLELVEVKLDGAGVTVISGNNAEGKSSLLRAIMAALGGKEALPQQPVRRGAKKSEIEVDLGDRVVKLKVREDRSATLTVEGKDGAVFRSPQALLNEMVGKLAFDPLEFLAREKDQAATLRKLVGIDTTALDAERQRVFDARTGVNRECKLLDAQLDGMAPTPEPPPPPQPPEPAAVAKVSVADLSQRHKQAVATIAENGRLRHAAEVAFRELAQLEHEEADLVARLEEVRAIRKDAEARHAQRAAVAEQLVDPDVAGIEAQLQAAEHDNAEAQAVAEAYARAEAAYERALQANIASVQARNAKEAETRAKHNEAGRLTARLEQIDEQKTALLAESKFPCAGLGIDGETVTYNGLPLKQASTGEQLSVCLAVAAALNPRLRVLLVRQGNDLDQARMRQLAEWALANGYQVLLERVAGDTPIGIVIESGKVAMDARVVAK